MEWKGIMVAVALGFVPALWLIGLTRQRLGRARALRRLDEAEWFRLLEKLRSDFSVTRTTETAV